MSYDYEVIDEVEAEVEKILKEHQLLWGCDDPACAVATSKKYGNPHEPPPTLWRKIARWFSRSK